MADEPQEPPKAADGGQTPAKADAAGPPKPPVRAATGATAGPPSGAVPPKLAAPAPKPPAKPPVGPDPWTRPLLEELQKRSPGAISEAVIFRNLPTLTVAKDFLVA